ncbi:MAG: hypothetical protein SH809_05420 [Rhodothermales bacterium]|nr:hypothetical protein [Rhodothermales bacterium]
MHKHGGRRMDQRIREKHVKLIFQKTCLVRAGMGNTRTVFIAAVDHPRTDPPDAGPPRELGLSGLPGADERDGVGSVEGIQ